MRHVKLDQAEAHEHYVRSLKANRFEMVSLPEGLPPLVSKPQGPFREPEDVRKQRYRPFSPSLRCEHDFESLSVARKEMKSKEWTQRLHDEMCVNKKIMLMRLSCFIQT